MRPWPTELPQEGLGIVVDMVGGKMPDKETAVHALLETGEYVAGKIFANGGLPGSEQPATGFHLQAHLQRLKADPHAAIPVSVWIQLGVGIAQLLQQVFSGGKMPTAS